MTADDYGHTQIAHIICLDPQVQPKEYALNDQRVEVGRSPLCQIVIRDSRISRKHACIERSGLRYEIYDLGSTNSTFVNGRLLANGERYLLIHNDYIGLGSAEHLLRFIDPDPTIEAPGRVRYLPHSRKFSVDGKVLSFTPNENLIMMYLYEHHDQLCLYKDCAEAVWDETFDAERDKVRLQRLICDVRAKLEGTNVAIEAQAREGYILRLTATD